METPLKLSTKIFKVLEQRISKEAKTKQIR